ncbi:SusD-like protein P2 [subsurface metagenome]
MRNPIYITILLVAVICVSACTELEQINPNFQTEESFWKTSQDFYQGLMGAYDHLQNDEMYSGKIQQTYNLLSDEGFTGELGEPLNLATFTSDMNNEFHVSLWYDYYTLVARSYEVIERGENSGVTGIDGIIGEAKFLVAFAYYNLLNTYGDGIAYVDGIQGANDRPRKAEPGEMWDFTEALLGEAIPVLPTSYPSSDFGRATRGAAQSLLAKVYMQQRDYASAEQILEQIVNSGYELNADYEANFTEELTTGNKEVIFQVNFLHNGPQEESDFAWYFRINTPGPSNIGIWADQLASEFATRSYLVEADKDGNYDPRMDVSLFTEYSNTTLYGQTWAWWEANTTEIVTGASFYKFHENEAVYDEINNGTGYVQWKNGGKDMIIFRYADILLLYAEALNENGKTSEAHDYVNMVRARSNMNALEVTSGRELNQTEFREQIKHERLVELCGEYLRNFDLKRWGEYGPQVAEDFTVPATGDVIERHPIFADFRVGQDELFPIPLDELDINPNLLPQNPGW